MKYILMAFLVGFFLLPIWANQSVLLPGLSHPSHIEVKEKKQIKEDTKEILIYDWKGKFLKQIFAPICQSHILELYPYTIKNHYIYQLDDAEDEWVLKIHKIN